MAVNIPMFNAIILLFYCVLSVFCKELPSFVHVCKRTDPEIAACLTTTLEEMGPYLMKGIPEMSLPPLDPFPFKNVSVDIGGSAVRMEANLINGVAEGLSKMIINSVKMDFEKGHFNVSLTFPIIRIRAQYKVKGKVLLFDLEGEGDAEFNATNVLVDFAHLCKLQVRDGETYAKCDKFHLVLTMKEMSSYFKNLFKGNDVLTESVNQAINDNLQALKEELDPIIGKTITEIYAENFIQVFDIFSMDKLYPE